MNNPISKKLKVVIIAIVIICGAGYVASYNQNIRSLTYTGYYWLFKFDHFDIGDKMYASESFINEARSTGLPLYKIMRPLTYREIKNMNAFEKSNLNIDENYIDMDAKPIAVACDKWLTKPGMKSQRSSYIGTYLESKYCGIRGEDKNHIPTILHTIFYAIKPSQLVFVDNGIVYKDELPINYTWTDSTLYLPALFAVKKSREM